MPEYANLERELTPKVRERLYRRYKYIREHDWEDFEDFARWAMDTGIWKGAFIRKNDESKPHGPENSYWSDQPFVGNRDWDRPEITRSPFCKGCSRNTKFGCGGCERWEEYFVQNWNKNIHFEVDIPKPAKVIDDGPAKFCYEHPDLIREGIV